MNRIPAAALALCFFASCGPTVEQDSDQTEASTDSLEREGLGRSGDIVLFAFDNHPTLDHKAFLFRFRPATKTFTRLRSMEGCYSHDDYFSNGMAIDDQGDVYVMAVNANYDHTNFQKWNKNAPGCSLIRSFDDPAHTTGVPFTMSFAPKGIFYPNKGSLVGYDVGYNNGGPNFPGDDYETYDRQTGATVHRGRVGDACSCDYADFSNPVFHKNKAYTIVYTADFFPHLAEINPQTGHVISIRPTGFDADNEFYPSLASDGDNIYAFGQTGGSLPKQILVARVNPNTGVFTKLNVSGDVPTYTNGNAYMSIGGASAVR